MIDINDYKIIYQRKIKKISYIWNCLLIFICIGIFIINKNFKYYDYYQNRGEYKDKYLNIYVLIDDIDKITKNKNILIDKKKFAYRVASISEDNIYLNSNYYKEVKLIIDKKEVDNSIIDFRIINNEYSLLEYVFKTVWR